MALWRPGTANRLRAGGEGSGRPSAGCGQAVRGHRWQDRGGGELDQQPVLTLTCPFSSRLTVPSSPVCPERLAVSAHLCSVSHRRAWFQRHPRPLSRAYVLHFTLKNKCLLMANILKFESQIMRIHTNRLTFLSRVISPSPACDSQVSQRLRDSDSVPPDGTSECPNPRQLSWGNHEALRTPACRRQARPGGGGRQVSSSKTRPSPAPPTASRGACWMRTAGTPGAGLGEPVSRK